MTCDKQRTDLWLQRHLPDLTCQASKYGRLCSRVLEGNCSFFDRGGIQPKYNQTLRLERPKWYVLGSQVILQFRQYVVCFVAFLCERQRHHALIEISVCVCTNCFSASVTQQLSWNYHDHLQTRCSKGQGTTTVDWLTLRRRTSNTATHLLHCLVACEGAQSMHVWLGMKHCLRHMTEHD